MLRGNCDDSPHDGRFRIYVLRGNCRRHNTCPVYDGGLRWLSGQLGIKYVSEAESPELHSMVGELAQRAGIRKPRIGIARMNIPNAFAFGRWGSDGRVCVTEPLMKLLNRGELKAVLGHEISHLKNRDVATITMLSVIPMILWYVAWNFMFSRDREGNNTAMIGIVAFILYFITNMLVLYASRIRELLCRPWKCKARKYPS